jgi:hypothetical protein
VALILSSDPDGVTDAAPRFFIAYVNVLGNRPRRTSECQLMSCAGALGTLTDARAADRSITTPVISAWPSASVPSVQIDLSKASIAISYKAYRISSITNSPRLSNPAVS